MMLACFCNLKCDICIYTIEYIYAVFTRLSAAHNWALPLIKRWSYTLQKITFLKFINFRPLSYMHFHASIIFLWYPSS
jgi:hypothetical protein